MRRYDPHERRGEARVRVVADTSTVISGLLWHGMAHQVLSAGRTGQIQLFTSTELLVELGDVLKRKKFAERLSEANLTASILVLGYASLATLMEPETIDPVILADPDDDAVLACALGAGAEIIVTADRHLLGLKQYASIPIVTVPVLLKSLNSRSNSGSKI